MSKEQIELGKASLRKGLALIPEANRLFFCRMYGNGDKPEQSYLQVIDNMEEAQVACAMKQVTRTLTDIRLRKA